MASQTLAVDGDGNGNGYGDGYGKGYGDGDGYGYGKGYGDGDGYGNGNGYGDGYGYGNGNGYGYGYGNGYGDGDGDGYGNGYGNGLLTQAFADHPSLASVDKDQVVLALWRSDAEGFPSNGGRATVPAHPGLLQEVKGPLRVCTANALHGDTDPREWSGDRWWVVALFEPVQRQGTKIGSLKRLIVEELA